MAASPDRSTPFLNSDGTISISWFMWLASLSQAIGGDAVGPGGGIAPVDNQKQFEEYAVPGLEGVAALRSVDELRNTVETMTHDDQPARAMYDELSNALAGIRQITDLRSRVELIEDRLA